jgi:NADH dehydrogenase FAD-containing subunit
MTAVHPDKNQIEVVTVDNLTQVIPYDVLVLCTGAEYAAPWKDTHTGTLDAYERERVFDDYREKIKNANSILCVGGGPLGVEVACKIRSDHPFDKRISILE